MRWPSLLRARRYGRGWVERLWLYAVGTLSGLLLPCFVVTLGLMTQLLVERGGGSRPVDPVLGPIVQGRWGSWPFVDERTCLLILAAAGFLLAVLEALSLLLLNRSATGVAERVIRDIKEGIREHAFQSGCSDLLGARSRPEQLFTEQCETLREGLAAWWRAVPRSFVALAALLLTALLVHPWLTLLALLLTGIIWRAHRDLRLRAQRRARLWHERAQQAGRLLQEELKLTPLTAAYLLTEAPGTPFHLVLREQENAARRAVAIESGVAIWTMMLVLLGATFLLLVLGLSSNVTVAGSVVMLAALLCAGVPAGRIVRLRTQLRSAEKAGAEVFRFLDREPSVVQAPQADDLQRLRERVQLEHVTLADRDGHKLLHDVSLTLPAGRRLAIVASEPQTPMALAGLILRFYDPTAGRVLYDGRDIRTATLSSVRGQAALISQDALLFTGTVADNIRCGETRYTTAQITEAARRAHSYELIQRLPEGLDTTVGEQGMRLSIGEAFGIALTRALLREPSLLVVQEPTEPMARELAAAFDDALAGYARAHTLLVLPSRLASLRAADHIFLLHGGGLLAQGSHAELLQSCELYRHLNYLRFSGLPLVAPQPA